MPDDAVVNCKKGNNDSTCGGFWTSWIPNSLPQTWPFCWWILVIVDHFSRKSIGFALFKKQPSSEEVTEAIDKAIERVGKTPKHTISDKGSQFHCGHFKNWCTQRNIKPCFGAIGRHGSRVLQLSFLEGRKHLSVIELKDAA